MSYHYSRERKPLLRSAGKLPLAPSFTRSHCFKLTQNTPNSKTEGNKTCDITSCELVRTCGQTVENIKLDMLIWTLKTHALDIPTAKAIKIQKKSGLDFKQLQNVGLFPAPSNESVSSPALRDNSSRVLHIITRQRCHNGVWILWYDCDCEDLLQGVFMTQTLKHTYNTKNTHSYNE